MIQQLSLPFASQLNPCTLYNVNFEPTSKYSAGSHNVGINSPFPRCLKIRPLAICTPYDIAMSKTILNLVMTFDGYVAGAHDEMDWLDKIHKRPTGSAKWDFSSFISKVGAIIVGKRSYELGVAQGWFKNQAYGSSPIFVLCESMPENPSRDADFRFVTTGIKDAHRQASAAAVDKWIYLFGGPNMFQQFLNEELVDEMRITIAPILIGKGIRLFDNLTERHIELERISVTDHPNGMIETNYRVMK